MEQNLKNSINFESLVTLFSQAPVALALLRGKEMIIEAANQIILEIWAKPVTVISLPLIEAVPELKDQEFPYLLNDVFETGIPYNGRRMPGIINRDGVMVTSYYDFIFAPIVDDNKIIVGVSIVATDVTESVNTENKFSESEFKFKELILNSQYCSAVYKGLDLVIEVANDKMLETWDKTESIIGLPLMEAVPSLVGQNFDVTMRQIFETGENYIQKEGRADIMRNGVLETSYYNYSFQPIKNANGKVVGIFNMALDVTDLVLAKKSAQENFVKLNNFIENAPMAIAVYTGKDFILEISNKHANKIWGDLSKYKEFPLKEIFPKYESLELFEHFHRVFESGEQLEFKEIKIGSQDHAEDLYHNYILHPIVDETGKTLSIIAIAYDVTKEIIMRRELSVSEKKYKNLAEAIPQIIWTSTADGIVTYCNERLQFYLGKEIENPLGKEFYNLCHPLDLEKVQIIWKKAVENESDFEVEYRAFNYTTQQYSWLLTRVVPSFDEEGKLTQWIGTSTDINEFKLLQAQKDTFLGIASHELKTPLTSLKLYAQVLERMLKKSGDDKNAEFANKMDGQISKLNSLIVDLLDVTKISAGKMQLIESSFNFGILAKEMIDELQLNSKHRLILENKSGGMVFADRDRISQVISNLISNAIKYSPDAEEIIITTSKENNDIHFCVKDFGIGVPADVQDKVFEQYYRVSGKAQNTIPGLGLGLYISADIIVRSKGKIWIESVLGEGSTFCFSLPIIDK